MTPTNKDLEEAKARLIDTRTKAIAEYTIIIDYTRRELDKMDKSEDNQKLIDETNMNIEKMLGIIKQHQYEIDNF